MNTYFLRYNKGTQIHCLGHPDFSDETVYHFILEKKFKDKYRTLTSCNLKKGFWYGFYKAFAEDLRVSVYAFDPINGLTLLERSLPSFTDTTVLINLDTEDYFEAQVWVDSVYNFSKKNNPKYILVQSNFSERFTSIFGNNPKYNNILFIPFKENIHYDHFFDISKQDPYETGPAQYGSFFCKNFTHSLVEITWNLYKSFKFPRDWNYITTEQFANDILGLESINDSEFRSKFTDYDYYSKIDQSKITQ